MRLVVDDHRSRRELVALEQRLDRANLHGRCGASARRGIHVAHVEARPGEGLAALVDELSPVREPHDAVRGGPRKVTLDVARTAFSYVTTNSNASSVTWKPTIIISVPSTAVLGPNNGTVTHSGA